MRYRDLIEYLEVKLLDSTATSEEYDLYIEYKQFGRRVLDENKYLCRKIIKEYKQIYEEE